MTTRQAQYDATATVAARAIALLARAGAAWRLRRYDQPKLYLLIGRRDYDSLIAEMRGYLRMPAEGPEKFMGATIVRLADADAPMLVTGQVEPTK